MQLEITMLDKIGLSIDPKDGKPETYTLKNPTFDSLKMLTLEGVKQFGIHESWCDIKVYCGGIDCIAYPPEDPYIQDNSEVTITLNWSPKAREAFQLLQKLQNSDTSAPQQSSCQFSFNEPVSSLLDEAEVDCISTFAHDHPDFDITTLENQKVLIQNVSAPLDATLTNS